MATLVHFDISADNPERVKIFYETLFNWQFELLPGGVNYYLIKTSDLAGAKGVGGGMAKREPGQQPGITNFIGVASIDACVKKIEQLGGKIRAPKKAVPGFGFIAVCRDTENNAFGLFEEAPIVA